MTQFIGVFKSASALVAIVSGGMATGMMADAIGNDTPVTLGGALAVGTVVVGGAWYLGRRLQKIEDTLKQQQSNQDSRHGENQDRFREIEMVIEKKL